MSWGRDDDPGLSWRKDGKDYGDLTDEQVAAEIAEHGAEQHEGPGESDPGPAPQEEAR